MENLPPNSNKKTASETPLINVWGLAGEIGLIIALPLVFFILIGIRVDRMLNTTPLFIIAALIFSMVISSIAIVRKVKKISQ